MTEAFDPLYRLPFATGMLVAFSLCEIGVYLRLRDEWMAALGVAHVSAAATLVATGLGAASGVGASVGACLAVALKRISPRAGNSAYVMLYLSGWALLMLVAANTTLGHALGRALLDGQIYFTGVVELIASIVVFGALLASSKWFS